MLHNIHFRSKETDPVLDWQDVFTEWKEAPREQTDDEMFEVAKLWAKAHNAAVGAASSGETEEIGL